MGMFDRIYLTCPNCGARVECQSKSGPCQLNEYQSLEETPANIVAGILGGDGWTECAGCEKQLIIEPTAFRVRLHKADVEET